MPKNTSRSKVERALVAHKVAQWEELDIEDQLEANEAWKGYKRDALLFWASLGIHGTCLAVQGAIIAVTQSITPLAAILVALSLVMLLTNKEPSGLRRPEPPTDQEIEVAQAHRSELLLEAELAALDTEED